MQHDTHKNTHCKDRPHDTIRARLAAIDDPPGTYRLDVGDDGELATLRYTEDGVTEEVAHLTPHTVTPITVGIHQTALKVCSQALGSPSERDAAEAIRDLDGSFWVRQRRGKWLVDDLDGEHGTTRLAKFVDGYAEVTEDCPLQIREALHEAGYTVSPFRLYARLKSAIPSEGYEVDVADGDRVIVRRSIDRTIVADASGDRSGRLRIRPEALDSEAATLKRAADMIDIPHYRQQPADRRSTLVEAAAE